MSYPIPTKTDPAQFEIFVERIMTVYKCATDDQERLGLAWYPVAHSLAATLSHDIKIGAGVLAALSQNKSWEINKRLALRAFTGDLSGQVPDALTKAQRILNGEDPADVLPMDLKTGQFFLCILHPNDHHAVTVDRHAHDVVAGERYGQRDRGLNNVNRYNLIADAYREAARRLGVLPLTVQAVTWVVWIARKGE